MTQNFAKNELTTNNSVGNYTVDSLIGQGTFGTVYKCFKTSDLKLSENERRYYAIKRIFRTKDKEECENNLKSAELESIFHKLAENGTSLFVKLFEVFIDTARCNQFHLVLECCDGENLMERYVSQNKTPITQHMVALCQQFFKAIQHLKRVNIIHADIKPENIMFTRRNSHEIKIIDFGNSTPDNTSVFNREADLQGINEKLKSKRSASYDLSKVVCPKKSRIVCTAEYRPPEVLFEFDWSYPVDVYSMGCIIYELLAGHSLMPPALDEDYSYDSFYQKNYHEKDLIDECAKDSHQEDAVGIIMKRRHLKCQELIAKKNKYDLDGFENLIFNADKNTYRHSKKKRGSICKIVKWCMMSDKDDNQVVDIEWVDREHLSADFKHVGQVDFLKFSGSGSAGVRKVTKQPVAAKNTPQMPKENKIIYNSLMILVMKMLIIDPEIRATADDLIIELEQVLKERTRESRRETLAPRETRESREASKQKDRARSNDREKELSASRPYRDLKRTFSTSSRQVKYNENGLAAADSNGHTAVSTSPQKIKVKFDTNSLKVYNRRQQEKIAEEERVRIRATRFEIPTDTYVKSPDKEAAAAAPFNYNWDGGNRLPAQHSPPLQKSPNSALANLPAEVSDKFLDRRDKKIDYITSDIDKKTLKFIKNKNTPKEQRQAAAGYRLFSVSLKATKKNDRTNENRRAPKRNFEYDDDKNKTKDESSVKNSRSDQRKFSADASKRRRLNNKRKKVEDEFDDPDDPININSAKPVKIKISKQLVMMEPIKAYYSIKDQAISQQANIELKGCGADPVIAASRPDEKFSAFCSWSVPKSICLEERLESEAMGESKKSSRQRAIRNGLEVILEHCDVSYI